MVQAMHLRADEYIGERAEAQSHVGMADRRDYRVEAGEYEQRLVRYTEEEQRREIDGSVEYLLERVKADARKPVEVARAVVSLVQPPPPVEAMFRTVHPVE